MACPALRAGERPKRGTERAAEAAAHDHPDGNGPTGAAGLSACSADVCSTRMMTDKDVCINLDRARTAD